MLCKMLFCKKRVHSIISTIHFIVQSGFSTIAGENITGLTTTNMAVVICFQLL